MDNYWNEKWADSNGSYFVVAPAGTYTIHARECEQISYSGPGWSTEYKLLNNTIITFNGNATANIIINFPNSTSSPTTTPTNTLTPLNAATTTPPNSTPTIPEFPMLTIPVLIILMFLAGLLVYIKKHKRRAV